MRVSPLLVALTLAALTSAPRIASAAPSAEPAAKATVENDIAADYMVGKEDVLEIAVFKYPDLNGPVTVRPDGKIPLKLIGDVQAEGRTIPQINKEIETKLGERDSGRKGKIFLHSFVVSNTPLGAVRWWQPGMATLQDFAKRHVLFQKEASGDYVTEIFARALSASPATA